jgi:hypothetical protein
VVPGDLGVQLIRHLFRGSNVASAIARE